MPMSKGVPIFISASAISAYRHFFSISPYRLSGNIFSADIADVKSSQMKISAISAYRQSPISAYRHIGKNVISAHPYL